MGDAAGAWHGIARHRSAPDCAKLCTVTVQLRKNERAREILPYPGKGKACGCGVIDMRRLFARRTEGWMERSCLLGLGMQCRIGPERPAVGISIPSARPGGMRIVFDIQAQKIVAAFLWEETRCAHDVDMGGR